MGSVEFFGEQFELAGQVSEFALMEFAESASEGVDGDTMAGMASMLRLIMECLNEPERARFRTVARKSRASAADLVKVLDAAFNEVAERPTGRSSDSSDGPPPTPQKSESNSDDKGLRLLDGRPDKQLAVLKMRAAASA